jgi:hypothetical protein
MREKIRETIGEKIGEKRYEGERETAIFKIKYVALRQTNSRHFAGRRAGEDNCLRMSSSWQML